MPALLALFGWGRIAGQAVAGWLSRRSLAEIGCIALALFAGLQTLRYHAERRHSAKLEVQLTHCSAARHADELAYRKAQIQAQAVNHAQVQKIEQQYQRNSQDERQAYLDDLAKLRASRVRPPATPAPGSPGPTGAPAPVSPSGGTDGDGLQVHQATDVPTSEDAAEIELRLMHLQNWVEKQLAVDPNTLREPAQH